MYTPAQMGEILKTIADAHLDAPREMIVSPLDKLCEICNGVGSDAMPEKLRQILTKILKYAEATAAIHDWDYSQSDGSEEARERADKRFRFNGLNEVEHAFPWYSWKRWWGERKVLMAFAALREGGRPAFLECFYTNSSKGKI